MNRHDNGHIVPRLSIEPPFEATPDPSLDRVLHALRNVEPGDGFHERLLVGLERTVGEPSTGGRSRTLWHRLLPGSRLVLGGVALAAMLLFILLLPRFHHSGSSPAFYPQTPPQAPSQTSSDSPHLAEAPLTVPKPPLTFSLGITNSARAGAAVPVRPADRGVAVRAASMPPPVMLTGSALPTQAALDSQALDDLSTRSQPAPANGPTRQEQAVRHILERDGSAQLAQLELTRDPARVAQERAAFHQFFEPKPIKKDEASSPDPTRSDSPGQP